MRRASVPRELRSTQPAAPRPQREGGRLAGLIEEAIVDAEAKARYLEAWAGCELHATLALGDGANDIHMLSTAGHALHYSCIAPSAPSLIHLLELLQRLSHIL